MSERDVKDGKEKDAEAIVSVRAAELEASGYADALKRQYDYLDIVNLSLNIDVRSGFRARD